MNAEVIPYHWDDRNKLYSDYQYLKIIYENMLKALQVQLNEIHQVDYSLRYWRILIGPWLGYFIQMVFDRWTMLKYAFKKYDINKCSILEKDENALIPNDMDTFSDLYYNDEWNEMIYSELVQEYLQNNLFIEIVKKTNDKLQPTLKRNQIFNFIFSKLQRTVIYNFFSYNKWINNSNKYFFINTYLPLSLEKKLLSRLGQEKQNWELKSIPIADIDIKMRDWKIRDGHTLNDDFISVLNRMIPRHIPLAYLEGYNGLLGLIKNLNWPRNPKCIFTSVLHVANDTFKAWTAEKVENGTSLIIGQHGGHFGMTPWSFLEEHQIEVSDTWLSWGWSNKTKPQILPIGNLKVMDNKVDYDPNGIAMMVAMTFPRYSYHMYAVPVASQWLSYFEDQCRFISALSSSLRNQILIKPFPHDWGWCQKERWSEKFHQIRFASSDQSIINLVNKSRLYISTYNATTYLESLAWNVPTIMFWNPDHWELRKDSIPYFELLKSAGIFHETPESAAKQMVDIWDDIPSWWGSEIVQNNRIKFCERYSYIPESPLEELTNIFLNVK